MITSLAAENNGHILSVFAVSEHEGLQVQVKVAKVATKTPEKFRLP